MEKNILILSEEIWSLGKNAGVTSLMRLISALSNNSAVMVFKPDEEVLSNVKYKNFKKTKNAFSNKYISYFFNIFSYFQLNTKYFIAGLRLRQKPDVIYVSSNLPTIAGYLLSKYYRIPYIQRQYGTFLFAKLNNWLELIKYYAEVISFLLPAQKFIITDDGTYGDRVAKHFNISNEKILFLKNGIDKEKKSLCKEECRKYLIEKLNLPPNAFLTITVSRLVKWKRVDRAINAFNMIKEKDAFLLIIGDGEEREHYESLKNNSNIIFLGALSNLEVQKYMVACDLFLSLYDLSNLGNPLLEAMNAGLPIITLNNGNTKSVYKNKNLILLPCSSEEDIVKNVYNNILLLKENVVLRSKIAKNAKLYAKEEILSWEDRISMEVKEILYWSNIN